MSDGRLGSACVADDSGTSRIKIAKVSLVNILEDELEVLHVVDGGYQLEFRAFEIKTVKIELA